MEILVLTTTVDTLENAQALARELIARRLAACVQVEPGLQSFYRWEGREHEDAEVRLTLKTMLRHREAIEALFGERHPYALPQFVCVTADASEAYARWVGSDVAPP